MSADVSENQLEQTKGRKHQPTERQVVSEILSISGTVPCSLRQSTSRMQDY